MHERVLAAALSLALGAAAAGCAAPQPSPRGNSPYRPVIIINAVTPAVAVLQGEGGPIEVSVTNAGLIPVQAIDVQPEAPVDDGAPFETEAKGIWPRLEPGEVAKATAIARPGETGDAVLRRFTVTYSGSVGGKESRRTRAVEVRLKVDPATSPIDDARSRGKVGSQAPGVYSATLLSWAFERPDGVVVVPDQGEPAAWPGISLRAVAWADLFADGVPLKFANPNAAEALSEVPAMVMSPAGPGAGSIPSEKLGELFAKAAQSGLIVETVTEEGKRSLIVK